VDSLLSKLNNLLSNHETHSTTELKIIRQLKQRAGKRKEEQKKHTEREEREWSKLDQQPDIVQLKFFLNRFGPVAGKKEFSDWRGAHNLAQGTGFVADQVKESSAEMDRIQKHLESMKQAEQKQSTSKKSSTTKIQPVRAPSKKREDDDDLFDTPLL
jgi:hypothetical protein